MDTVGAIVAGLAGTAVMTALIYVAPLMGMPRMDIIGFLGAMVTSNRDRATILGVLFLTACGGIVAGDPTGAAGGSHDGAETEGPKPAALSETSMPIEDASTEASVMASPTATPELLPQEPAPRGAEWEFGTDFELHTVAYDEILSGGPPKDGIPAIDKPNFLPVEEADEWLEPQEPVVLLQVANVTRAYPVQILMWHEIVNDVVGGVPVAVSFCPLCNTAIAFERTFEGQVLDFGTTGRLRYSNLIMYDRQTETWWQQASGEGIAGKFAGRQLTFLPASIVSWADFKAAHPGGEVLSRDTGFGRRYGQNPYLGYDDVNRSPFLYDGPQPPDQLLPMARVLTLDLNGQAIAYPYQVLEEIHVVNDTVAGTPVAVFWDTGTASALDAGSVAGGRDVGTAVAFSREVQGDTLTFRFQDGSIMDEHTGSEWNVLGQGIAGPLAGAQLEPVVSINHFWFSWAAFRPETRIFKLN